METIRSRLSRLALVVASAVCGCAEPGGPPPDDPLLEPFVTTMIDSTVGAISDASSVIEPGGRIHIAYSQDGYSNLRYAVCDSACATAANWRTIAVDTTSVAGYFNSLVRDEVGRLHVTYRKADPPGELRYATCSTACDQPASWQVITLDAASGTGWRTTLAAAGTELHAFYLRYANVKWYLQQATCVAACTNPSSWQILALDSAALLTTSSRSARSDAGGVLHLMYSRGTPGGPFDLVYRRCATSCGTAAGWQSVTIDSTSALGPELELHAGGARALYWSTVSANALKYAACDSTCLSGTNWSTLVVVSADAVGYDVGFTLGSDGRPHVAFRYDGEHGLQYAVCAAACSTSPWPTVGVPSSHTAATPTVLLLGAGRVGIPYLQAGDPGGFLVYAESR